MAWYKIFAPDITVKNYQEVTIEMLKELGCELFLVDLDNTLVPYDVETPTAENINFLDSIQKAGIKVALLSNNAEKRVKNYAEKLNIKYYAKALKPLPKIYKTVLKDFGVKKEELLCIGDQLLTDVLGAHLANVKVIWTRPLVKRDIFYTKINRQIEQFIIKTLMKKGYIDEEV